jgi:histidyl-tRNA synthetase
LGDSETKEKYKNELGKFVEKNNPDLCEDCQRRYQTNPLRILDCLLCKNKSSYPSYKDTWNEKDINYINELNQILDKFNFPYQYDYHLVRGLDYYTGLVFEVDLGTEKALLGGGRYDNLYQNLGDINAPAVGFAIGIERLADYLESSQLLEINKSVDVFFLATSPEVYLDILVWKKELEKYPLVVDYNPEVRKIKSLPKIIDYYQPKILIVLGEQEPQNKKILIKDCQKRQEFLVEKEKVTK